MPQPQFLNLKLTTLLNLNFAQHSHSFTTLDFASSRPPAGPSALNYWEKSDAQPKFHRKRLPLLNFYCPTFYSICCSILYFIFSHLLLKIFWLIIHFHSSKFIYIFFKTQKKLKAKKPQNEHNTHTVANSH